jgi:hypothetical protein
MVWCMVRITAEGKRLSEFVRALVPPVAEGDISVGDDREQTENPSEGSQQEGGVRCDGVTLVTQPTKFTSLCRTFHDSLLGFRVHVQYLGYIVYKGGIAT